MARIWIDPDPGDSIKHTATKALNIANILDITVRFRFNSVDIWVHPGENPGDVVWGYDKAIASKHDQRRI